jgi:endonuclease/exonuclease/phosphatase family metal-dependent hydrolase
VNTFSVATLNLWNIFGPWSERQPVLEAQLRTLPVDVIGFQEVFRQGPSGLGPIDQAKLVADVLGFHMAFGASYKDNDGHTGNAIASRWPIVREECIQLAAGNAGEARCLLFAELDAPFGRVPFFCTHLNYKLHDCVTRIVQVQQIADQVERLAAGCTFPAVLVGDFNAEPDSDEMRFLRGLTGFAGKSVYYADAYHLAGEGPHATFSKHNAFAEPWREPERRIDYVYVRAPEFKRGEPVYAARIMDQPMEGVYATDHYGVLAKIRIE